MAPTLCLPPDAPASACGAPASPSHAGHAGHGGNGAVTGASSGFLTPAGTARILRCSSPIKSGTTRCRSKEAKHELEADRTLARPGGFRGRVAVRRVAARLHPDLRAA